MTARILALVGVLIALVTIVLSVPLYRGEIAMNHWYGIRVPWAFESEAMWYKVNRIGGKIGIICGAVYGVIMAIVAVFPPTSRAWFLALAWSPIMMLVVLLALTVAATKDL